MSRTLSILFAGIFLGALSSHGLAAEPTSASGAFSASTTVPDLFEAQSQDLVSVRYIPNDSRSAQVIVTNKSRRPLTLRLPAAFAGIPVLAQMGGMGGGGGGRGGQQGGFATGGIGGGQATGGGGGGMGGMGGGGMGGGGMGGMGGGAFSIPAERTRVFRVTTVCLEHGKPEPSSRMPYKFVKVDAFSSDPKLDLVLQSLGRGELSQKVAQAAAWHVANGMTWEQLAAKEIDHAGGNPDEPYFTQAELLNAHRVVALATQEATRRKTPNVSTSAIGGSNALNQ